MSPSQRCTTMVEVKRISQLDWEFAPLKPDSQSASIELMLRLADWRLKLSCVDTLAWWPVPSRLRSLTEIEPSGPSLVE